MEVSRRTVLALGGAATLGAGAFWVKYRSKTYADTTIVMSPQQALAAVERGGVLLVDIRRPDEWERTGVGRGAVTIDMRDARFLDRIKDARVSQNQPVAVICARGVRSYRMTRRLEEAGIGPLIDIPEGMLGSSAGPGWIARGLPVVKVN